MIFLLLSILIVYPDNNEKIDDLFIVISEIGDTIDFRLTLDGNDVKGDFEIGENTLIIKPEEINFGYHTITLYTPYDTITHTFFYQKNLEKIEMEKKRSFTDYDAGFFWNRTSLNPDNPIIEGFCGLYGTYPHFSYRIYLNSNDIYSDEQLKSQFTLRFSSSFLSLTIGDQYPEISRIALSSRRITGLNINLLKTFTFLYGDMTRKRGDTPQSTIIGFTLGNQGLRFIVLRGRELNPSTEPYDNAIIGFSSRLKILSVSFDGGIFGSIYTMDRNINDSIIKMPEEIFTLNSTTIPLFPTTDVLSYYLDIASSTRKLSFTHFGKSFYNRMNYGTLQGLWKIDYYDSYRFNEYVFSLNFSFSRTNFSYYRLNTSFLFPNNSIQYSLSSSNNLSNSLLWSFNKNISTSTYIYLGGTKRFTMSVSYPFIVEPSFKVEFSKGLKPYYEIGAIYRWKYFSLNPKISYYNGSLAGIIGLNGSFNKLSYNLNLQYSSLNYRIYISSYYRNELPF